eukprot:TRINITY_DN16295_c2_g1_i1.p1 TRINITY_DN16295_c2_g1~~TRINITY_DN16295_c2_g1_i1.p1  ORF type:complete len:250 (+),score=96.54 TRINITY_DN16295_c2_g1_i1:84-752(+)
MGPPRAKRRARRGCVALVGPEPPAAAPTAAAAAVADSGAEGDDSSMDGGGGGAAPAPAAAPPRRPPPRKPNAGIPPAGSINYADYSLKAYRKQHAAAFVPAQELSQDASRRVAEFKKFEQEQVERRQELSKPDEEGWVTVVSSKTGTHSATSQLPKTVNVQEYQKRRTDANKKKQLESKNDFYAFSKTRKNMQRLIKMKKILRQARARAPVQANLRNFADRC